MIGFRVKLRIARVCRWRALAAACVVAVGALASCSGAPSKPAATKPPPEEVPAPGAERWVDGALLLPKASPAVAVARLDEVLDAASRLKAWVVAEPAMLGEDGEQTAQSIEAGWLAAKGYLGVDPLSPRSWAERGVDPTRPIYAGLYPVSEEGTRFLVSVDGAIRRALGLPGTGTLAPSLRALAETTDALPEGTNAEILRAVGDSQPLGGIRVVVPVTSAHEFMTTAASFAEGMGLVPFGGEVMGQPLPPETLAFRSTEGGPSVAVHIEGSHAVLDVVSPAFVGRPSAVGSAADVEREWSELQRALGDVEPGRPRAPAPADSSSIAVTVDQEAMADFVRLRGYRESLEGLHLTSTDRRDAILLDALLRVLSESGMWDVASDELTGTSYELRTGSGDPNEIGRLSMTLFANRELPPLGQHKRFPTLGVDQHSAGVGVSVAGLRDERWRAWFTDETAAELDQLEFDNLDPLHVGLPFARMLAITGSNLGDARGVKTFSTDLAETIGEFEGVWRAEFVTVSADLTHFETHPQLLAAFVLDPAQDREQMVSAVRTAFVGLLSGWFELPPGSPASTASIPQRGQTTELNVDGIGVVREHVTASDPPVLVYGVGIDPEEFDEEIAGLEARRSAAAVLEGRLEPIALVSWLRGGDPEALDPIDGEILAQRLGPLVLRYAGRRVGEANAITLDLTLHTPPRL